MNLSKAIIRSFLALCFLTFSATGVYAESGMYRVELLVFSHIDSAAEPVEAEELRAFLAAADLDQASVQPAPYRLENMSSAMQDVWRRLRLSAGYRPLLFTSWEQTRVDYHPAVRVHDEELVAEQVVFPYPVVYVDLQDDNMFEKYLMPFYKLDGIAQLTRSRFLHLAVDLEYRQELLPQPVVVPDSREDALEMRETAMDVIEGNPGPALIHRIKQSRQIRTGQMHYFDTPYLGVLARVTATSGE